MPTYEYECTRCKQVFEEFKPMSAPPRQRCPKCRGKVNRLISGGLGIVFKGSGFYQNDSRPKRTESASETVSGTTVSSESSGNSKSAGNDNNTTNKNKS